MVGWRWSQAHSKTQLESFTATVNNIANSNKALFLFSERLSDLGDQVMKGSIDSEDYRVECWEKGCKSNSLEAVNDTLTLRLERIEDKVSLCLVFLFS